MKKSKSKKKKVVIAVSGMILAVSIGAVGFKYKNEIINISNLSEYNTQTEDGTELYNNESTYELAWENVEKNYSYKDVISVNDGYVAIASESATGAKDGGQIVKYDLQGNVVWENVEKDYVYTDVINVDDGYIALSYDKIVKYSLDGKVLWDKELTLPSGVWNKMDKIDDGIIISSTTNILIKTDFNGEELWRVETGIDIDDMNCMNNQIFITRTYRSSEYVYSTIFNLEKYNSNGEKIASNSKTGLNIDSPFTTVSNDGIYMIGGSDYDGSYPIAKFDLEGNYLWSSRTSKDSIDYRDQIFSQAIGTPDGGVIGYTRNEDYIVKYDKNGFLQLVINSEDIGDNGRGIACTNDGIVVVYNDGTVKKYDYGIKENLAESSNENNGMLVWENVEKNYSYKDVISVNDGYVAIASESATGAKDGGQIVKYDLQGNVVWENVEKDYVYTDVINVDDGYIALSYDKIVKYSLDGKVLWDKELTLPSGVWNKMDKIDDGIIISSTTNILIKTDFNGEELWRVETGIDIDDMNCMNNQIFITRTYRSSEYVYSTIFNLEKYNSNGEKIASNSKTGLNIDSPFTTVSNDGIYMIGGSDYDGSYPIAKFDLEGNYLWSSRTSKDSIDYRDQIFSQAIGTPDGGVIGYTRNEDYIVKYDKNGFLQLVINSEDIGDNGRGIACTNDGIVVVYNDGTVKKYYYDYNIIDRSALDEILEEVGKLEESDYSDETWQDLQDAITGTDDLTSQDEIDAKVEEIQEAIDNLDVDRSELDKILEEVGKLEESDYSDETWQDLQDAIAGVDDLTKQSEIDAKVDEIQEAIDNLGVDRSALDALLEQVAGLNEADYSDSSWDALQNAIAGTDNLTKQSEIDAKVQEIQNALDNLDVDRSALDALLEQVAGLNEADYSDSSWDALQGAISGTDNLTKQSEIDAKVQEIQNALDNLGVDRSALDALLEQVAGLNEADYSDSSWDALQGAISGTDNLTKQSEIDAKVQEIQKAIDNLGVDRSALDALLEQVAGLNEADYSDSSWDALQGAISGTDNLTKQSEIDAKVQEIQNALSGLGVDRSALDALLEQVAGLIESDYSDESWQELQEAVSGADSLVKQTEIDAKVDEIQEAIDNLGVDRSELDRLLTEVGRLTESDYSDSSWEALQNAISGTDNLTKQSEIDTKVQEIRNALSGLGVDRSTLDALLEQVAGLNEADYSNSSWDALQDAISGTDNLTKQSEIDSKVQEIQNALDNLGIDRSVLDALLENVSKLNPSDYSDESWNALQQAITGTDNLTKQSEIDAKVEEIKNAVDGLGIDRSALDAILAEVEKLVETDYSKASWDVLENAVNMSDTVTTQSQVDNAVEQIRNAMDGLTIDRSQLDRLLEEVKKLNSSDYSNSSWNALQQAITGTDNLTKQSEIDAKVNEIQNAINNLGIDRSELDRLLEEIRNLKERDYSVESWTNLQNVVKGSDTLTKQDEVNKKVDDLQKALAALTVDRTKLDEIIKKVESMDSTKYTIDSWQALEGLLDVDELTKQYEIDDRVEDIQDAINNLILDMSKLEDLIDQSENLNKDDYTEDSWNNLDQTVTDIKDKINNGEINEDNIDDYVTKLQDALNSLQKNEDKNATDDQNVNTSDIMGMGLILTFIVSVLGILKNVKKFIFKK